MTDVFHITPERKQELEDELAHRKGDVRKDILERLQFAKSLGDLSENAEYHAARENQGKNESRIGEVEHILKNHVIVEKTNDGIVHLGSTVEIEKVSDGALKTYTIVGAAEADMANGKLSNESPLGAGLVDKTVDDTVTITTPKGEVVYKIKSIS